MSAPLLRGILGRAARLRPTGTAISPRARLTGKVSEQEIGTGASIIGFSVLSAVILIPAAWFLSHIENYKKRD